MKKLIFAMFLAALCLSCTNRPHTISYKDREIVTNQLRQPGSKNLNINNLFEITIPENMEILSIDQRLVIDRDNPRYYVSHNLHMVYNNKYFVLIINCFGNNNRSILEGKETLNLRTMSTGITSQYYILQENYNENPFYNQNDVKLGKLVAGWGSHWSSDIFGLYFKLNNADFNECEILLYNLWGSFTDINVYDLTEENYIEKSIEVGGIIENIIQDLNFLEDSISFSLSDNSIKIITGNIGEAEKIYVRPTENNIPMMQNPAVSSEITGYMREWGLYDVLLTGEDIEIDGINGNWLMVIPIPYRFNDVAWAFSGHTKELTSDELNQYFEGL